MKACEIAIEYGTAADAELVKNYGKQLHEVDRSGGYETDSVVLHQKGRGYALLRASSCSCYTAIYDGWIYTKAELLKWAEKAVDYYGAEEEMAVWIKENIK